MRLKKVFVIAKREFLTRVKTKSFWLATFLLPLLMAAVYTLPVLVLFKGKSEQKVVLVDVTGGLGGGISGRLSASEDLPVAQFKIEVEPAQSDTQAQRDALDRRLLDEEINAWVWIDDQGLAEDRVEYHGKTVSGFLVQEILEDAISDEVTRSRLLAAGYDPEEVGELGRRVRLRTIKVTEEGSRAEAGELGFIVGFAVVILLYMVILVWGVQVMNGVLEEKTSRVVEVMISTVRPVELLMGKLLGIGATGLTQLSVWLATAALLTAPSVIAAAAWLPEGVSLPSVPPSLVFHLLAFFVLGFLLFASMYAAIGAAFNNMQEAQQFTAIPMVFLLVPMMLAMPIINTPDANWVVMLSLIPFFSPTLIPLRMAIAAVPLWQVAMAYVLTLALTLVMIWISSRIYRTGILMHGKKPTIKELWRWLRYA